MKIYCKQKIEEKTLKDVYEEFIRKYARVDEIKQWYCNSQTFVKTINIRKDLTGVVKEHDTLFLFKDNDGGEVIIIPLRAGLYIDDEIEKFCAFVRR